MQSLVLLAIAAAAIEILAYVFYVRDICSGRSRPSRASWLIWAPLAWLTLASQWQAGGELILIKLTAMCLGITAVAVLALRFGTGGWSRLDRFCFLITALGVVAWVQTREPVLALLFFILADMAAAAPTVRDAALHPDKDSRAAWSASLVAAVLNLAVVPQDQWSASWAGFGIWGFNVYLVLLDGLVVGLMERGRLRAALAGAFPAARLVP